MAVLGAQSVITLIMISFMQKLRDYSLARWLLCSQGLYRYLYPTDSELKALTGRDKIKGKKSRHENGKAEVFHVPRSLEIKLETAPITPLDVVHLRFYSEYYWIMDFSLYTAIVYIMSEVYTAVFPLKDEFNLSMVWCLLVVIFSIKTLLSLTKQYFTSEDSMGERSTTIVSFSVFLLIAMMVLIVDEKNLEVGVDPAYDSFYENASKFLDNQGLTSVGPASKLIIKLCLAVWAATIGAMFTFPGLRVARMHWDALKEYKDSKVKALLLNINFAMPFILVLLWVRPIARHYLTVRVFSGMEKPLMSSEMFDTVRIVLVVGTCVSRLCLLPALLQGYLDMARRRLEAQRSEAGNITNVDLQKKVSSVFHYLCAVSLQYSCPVLLTLHLGLLYKTLGGHSWAAAPVPALCRPGAPSCWLVVYVSSVFYYLCAVSLQYSCPVLLTLHLGLLYKTLGGHSWAAAPVPELCQPREHPDEFLLAWENLKMVFTQQVYRGLFGFMTWWCCFAWFLTSAAGLGYQTYFRIS